MKPLTIAVDGPASAGKGTVARGVAQALGYQYVDTGAMYRAVALLARERGIGWDDAEALAALAAGMRFRFTFAEGALRVAVDGRDVTAAIREDAIGTGASEVSRHPQVRAALLGVQRALGARGGVVMDGRDIGTVVLPDAELKIYLDADLEVRARRRHEELHQRGTPRPLEDVRETLARRDRADMERATAPLKPAPDAVHIDTTRLDIQAATDAVLRLARERGA